MRRSDLYRALKERAKAAIPGLRFVDLQKGQMKDQKQHYPFPLPALLIELKGVRWSNLLEENQLGELVVRFYFHQDAQTDSFSGSCQENESVDLLDNMDLIYETFEGFATEGITPLVRLTGDTLYEKRSVCFVSEFKTTINQGLFPSDGKASRPDARFKFKR